MKKSIIHIIRPIIIYSSRVFFVFICLPILYVLEPFKKLRFHLVYTKRIGHLAGNTDLFLRKLQIGTADTSATYILAGIEPVNRQLFEMLKRELNIYESRWLTRFLFYIRPIIKCTRFWEQMAWMDPGYQGFNHGKASLTFNVEEETRGREFLRSIGIKDDDWYVCLHNRDAAYLDNYMPQEKALWQTRNFRNCSVSNYLKAAEYITSQGGYVLRMGAVVGEPLPDTGNSKIIDYATKHREDFLDIFLPAKCRFFLGCDSGIFVIASIFDVPVALANCNLIAYNPFRRDDLFTLTRVFDEKAGAYIHYKKAQQLGYYNIGRGAPALEGYRVVENTPDDILELAKEMYERLEGEEPDPAGVEANKVYRDEFLTHIPFYQDAPNLGGAFALSDLNLIQTEQN